jgi:tetratricopeptide (TPR) repeat protein
MLLLSAAVPALAEETDPTRQRFREAVELVDAGRFEEALIIFREVEAARPHAVVTFNIAWCLSELGRRPEAIEAFESYLAGGDDDAGRLDQARRQLETLRAQEPATPAASDAAAEPEPEPGSAREPEPAHERERERERGRGREAPRTRRRLHPAVFWSLLGLSVATAAAMTGTGAATLGSVDDLERGWQRDEFDHANALQDATDGLLGVLLAEAVATALVGVFTDFRRERERERETSSEGSNDDP